ncbi:MAG TPA: nucleotidyltransferase family protein [Capillimicrobium sp.]|nr:nucleotidyltransferase family protein [Capillimicrobium sp.]
MDVTFDAIKGTMRRCAAVLRDADVPYALGGSVAAWARGGPETCGDLDFVVAPSAAERAQAALADAGLRAERPPEGWLLKAYDGDVLVDLIFELTGVDVAAALARADVMAVAAIDMPVLAVEDLLTAKLLAFNDHYLDFAGPLQIVRALREQIDWDALARATAASPHARGFLALARELDVMPAAAGELRPVARAAR